MSESHAFSANEAFWAKAYTENFSTLCARATRRLTNGNTFEAEDAVSEAFVRGMRYAQDPEAIRNVASYLWTTVKRVWAAQQVRLCNKRTQHLEDMDVDEIERLDAVRVEPDVLRLLDNEAALLAFRMKLGPLTLAEQTLVELRRGGYSFEEMADQLGESASRTRFRWYRFIARQRKRINRGAARPSLN